MVHYGRVPPFKPASWDFRVFGATASGEEHGFAWDEFERLPRTSVTADFHCVTKFSMMDLRWRGVTPATILERSRPPPASRHVMIWAEYGYSANLRTSDFTAPGTLLATDLRRRAAHRRAGAPLRLVVPHLYAWKSVKWVRAIEYLVEDRRGFWEERGYHNVADPWREQRYSYQEEPGEGPA